MSSQTNPRLSVRVHPGVDIKENSHEILSALIDKVPYVRITATLIYYALRIYFFLSLPFLLPFFVLSFFVCVDFVQLLLILLPCQLIASENCNRPVQLLINCCGQLRTVVWGAAMQVVTRDGIRYRKGHEQTEYKNTRKDRNFIYQRHQKFQFRTLLYTMSRSLNYN